MIYDSATVIETAIRPPSPAWIDDTLSITGTARMLRGPESPIGFEGYRMEYAPFEDTTAFIPLTGIVPTPVYDGELCAFPTFGLDVGNYYIRMWYFFSPYGEYDSLSFDNTVYLTYNTGIDEVNIPNRLSIQTSPNPFNSAITISLSGGVGASDARSGQVGIEIYDISGRLVADLPVTNCGEPQFVPTPRIWRPEKSLGSGVYLVRARIGNSEITRRIVYLK